MTAHLFAHAGRLLGHDVTDDATPGLKQVLACLGRTLAEAQGPVLDAGSVTLLRFVLCCG
jgi:hypothetical protein